MSRSVAVVTGRLFRGSEMSLPAQAAAEDAVGTAATAVLKRRDICSLYGALACGVDIISPKPPSTSASPSMRRSPSPW